MKIFIIIFDTLRKDHTGKTYGNSWIKTPNFDKFAKDSLVFDKSYPESLPTIPFRRSTHTGIRTFPFNHEKPLLRTDDVVDDPGWAPVPPNMRHMVEYLKDDKYISAFITSTYHQFKPNMNFHLGFDQWNWIRGHEFDKYRVWFRGDSTKFKQNIEEHITRKRKMITQRYHKLMLRSYLSNVQDRENESQYFPGQTFQKAVEFVKDTISQENTFCVIDEFDPHEPWDPPQKYLDLYVDKHYTGKKVIIPFYSTNLKYLTEGELKYLRASYAGEVSLCDNWFGYFIEELKNLEIYNDSLIMFISDHGHSIGEHNATGKIPMYLYPELVDIPFMIKPPGNIRGPKRIKKTYVYNHDILPTIFGFLGKEKPDIFEGKDVSLFVNVNDQLLEGRDYITCGFHLSTLYKDDHYAFITANNRSKQKLFDLSKDPEWNNNIAEDNPDLCNEFYKKIEIDAKGELLMSYSLTLNQSVDWYGQSSIKNQK
ncbi:MAG: sulfatase [Candidatus Hodarchaeota archaeon]